MSRLDKLRILVMIIAALLAFEFSLIATGFYIVYNDIEEITLTQRMIIEEIEK